MLKESLSPETRKRVSSLGGKATARKLTPAQRSERARKAAYARHHNRRSNNQAQESNSKALVEEIDWLPD